MNIQNVASLSQAAQLELRAGPVAPSANGVAPRPPAPPPSPQQVQQAVDLINRAVQPSNSDLEFNIDADTQKVVVRMVDTATGQLIRQIPSETVLAIAESIDQYQKGLLLTQRA
jgi:flagellar protein FlaG